MRKIRQIVENAAIDGADVVGAEMTYCCKRTGRLGKAALLVVEFHNRSGETRLELYSSKSLAKI